MFTHLGEVTSRNLFKQYKQSLLPGDLKNRDCIAVQFNSDFPDLQDFKGTACFTRANNT